MKTLEVFEKVKSNEAVLQSLRDAKTEEETYEILKKEGLTDTYDVFMTEVNKVKETYSKMNQDELASIVGGGCGQTSTTTTTTSTTIGTIGIAASVI